MKILGIATVALAALATAPAYAGSDSMDMPYVGPSWRLQQMDSNNDGFVSRDEFYTVRTIRFSGLDANRDGVVTIAERQAAVDNWNRQHPNDKILMTDADRLDLTSDGYNTYSEVLFNDIDANGNGMVSQVEFDNAHKTGRLYHTHAMGVTYSGPAWWLSQMDTDNTGTISRAEFNAGRTIRFASLDDNRDGVVTVAERGIAMDRWNSSHPNDMVQLSGDHVVDLKSSDYDTNSGVLFDKLDSSRDDEISKVELNDAHNNGQLDRTIEGNTDRDASQPVARRTTGTGSADRSGDGTGNAPQVQ